MSKEQCRGGVGNLNCDRKEDRTQSNQNTQNNSPDHNDCLLADQWHDLLDYSIDVVFRYNVLRDRYDYISQSVENHIGYTRDEVLEKGGKLLVQNIHPNDRDTFWGFLLSCKDNSFKEEKIHLEYRYRHKNGHYVWRSDNVRIIRNDNGTIIALVGNSRDITPKKKIELDLKNARYRFTRNKQDPAAIGIVIHDEKQFIQADQQFAEMFGYSMDEFEKLSGYELIEPDFHEMVKEYIESGYKDAYEIVCRRKNGSTFPAEIRASEIKMENKCLRIAAIRDLTSQKKTETKLAKNEKGYKKLYQNNHEALLRIRLKDSKVLECSQATADLLGCQNTEDLNGRSFTTFFVNPEKYHQLLETLDLENKVTDFEIQFSLNGTTTKWASLSARTYPDQDLLEGSLHDMTAHKVLSAAEMKVLRHLLAGKCNKEVARSLKRSVRTIEDHRSRIMHKLGVDNLVDLTREALKYDITPVSES